MQFDHQGGQHNGKDDGTDPAHAQREDAAALMRMLRYIALEGASIGAWECVAHALMAETSLSRMFDLNGVSLFEGAPDAPGREPGAVPPAARYALGAKPAGGKVN